MRKWIVEDWEFNVTVTSGDSINCRLGLEKGDRFTFQYECPTNFCPRTMIELYTWCEVIRCGGDFISRGCKDKYKMDLTCPCKCIDFQLVAIPINRDNNGVYIGKSERSKN